MLSKWTIKLWIILLLSKDKKTLLMLCCDNINWFLVFINIKQVFWDSDNNHPSICGKICIKFKVSWFPLYFYCRSLAIETVKYDTSNGRCVIDKRQLTYSNGQLNNYIITKTLFDNKIINFNGLNLFYLSKKPSTVILNAKIWQMSALQIAIKWRMVINSHGALGNPRA